MRRTFSKIQHTLKASVSKSDKYILLNSSINNNHLPVNVSEVMVRHFGPNPLSEGLKTSSESEKRMTLEEMEKDFENQFEREEKMEERERRHEEERATANAMRRRRLERLKQREMERLGASSKKPHSKNDVYNYFINRFTDEERRLYNNLPSSSKRIWKKIVDRREQRILSIGVKRPWKMVDEETGKVMTKTEVPKTIEYLKKLKSNPDAKQYYHAKTTRMMNSEKLDKDKILTEQFIDLLLKTPKPTEDMKQAVEDAIKLEREEALKTYERQQEQTKEFVYMLKDRQQEVFYDSVKVVKNKFSDEPGFLVRCGANKYVATQRGKELVIPNRTLAHAIATEWEMQTDEVRSHLMPLTDIMMTIDNNALVDDQKFDLIDKMRSYFLADEMCYRAGIILEKESKAKINDAYDKVVSWFNTTYRVNMPVKYEDDYNISSNAIEKEIAEQVIEDDLSHWPKEDIYLLHEMCEQTNSIILALAFFNDFVSYEECYNLADMSVILQTGTSGVVQGAHDVDSVQKRVKLSSLKVFQKLYK